MSRLSSRSACSTDANPVEKPAPPTRWVGESGVSSDGELVLDRLQLPQQDVELAIGHGGRVEHVVPELGIGDLLGQLGMPVCGIGWDIDRGRRRLSGADRLAGAARPLRVPPEASSAADVLLDMRAA